jgi:hypothetical protein
MGWGNVALVFVGNRRALCLHQFLVHKVFSRLASAMGVAVSVISFVFRNNGVELFAGMEEDGR